MITKDKVSEFFVLQTISAKNLKLRCQKTPYPPQKTLQNVSVSA